MKFAHICCCVAFCLVCLVCLESAEAQQLEWTRQLGTAVQDVSLGVAADTLGNVYIGGAINGDGGALDAAAFLSRFDAAGNLQWTKEFGTDKFDQVNDVSLDPTGNVFAAGFTEGSFGAPHVGSRDAFLSKVDAAGTVQWSRQFGTNGIDEFNGVATDSVGNAYVTGYTGSIFLFDALLRKYDADGNLQWTRQVNTAGEDFGIGVTVDLGGNVYMTGSTQGSLDGMNAGSHDAYLQKYDTAGNLQWTRQFGTVGIDAGSGVSTDSLGNVYIVGWTEGDLAAPNAGPYDAYLRKYDASGVLQWTRQLGTVSDDQGVGISADALGGIYISGATQGSLDGINAGDWDSFVSKYDAAGNLRWTRQLGTAFSDQSYSVSTDSLGNAYISGFTYGSLDGPNLGFQDAFVAKYNAIPEPGALLLGSLAYIACQLRRRRNPLGIA